MNDRRVLSALILRRMHGLMRTCKMHEGRRAEHGESLEDVLSALTPTARTGWKPRQSYRRGIDAARFAASAPSDARAHGGTVRGEQKTCPASSGARTCCCQPWPATSRRWGASCADSGVSEPQAGSRWRRDLSDGPRETARAAAATPRRSPHVTAPCASALEPFNRARLRP